jgi:hypothetical protein
MEEIRMADVASSTASLWILAVIEIVGLASAWMARLSLGSRRQRPFQALFIVCLLLSGATTVLALPLGAGCWLTASTTFAIMVLTATCDFSRSGCPGTCEW